jgi:hypothetical protein
MRNSLEKIVIALSKSNIILKRVTLPQKYGERYTFALYEAIKRLTLSVLCVVSC